jgi:hypothetical protein
MSHRKTQLSELDARRLQKQHAQYEQNWSQVEDIYRAVAEGIVDVVRNINDAIQLINTVGVGVDDVHEMVIVTTGIRRDVEAFTSDLVKIHNRHSNYTGVITDADELALCLSVFNDYVTLNDRFRAIIFTPMLSITEFLADAATSIPGVTHDQ